MSVFHDSQGRIFLNFDPSVWRLFLTKFRRKSTNRINVFINVISDLETRSRSITIADFARKKYPPSHSPKLFFLQKFGAAACQHVSLIDAIHYDYSDEQTLCSASPSVGRSSSSGLASLRRLLLFRDQVRISFG